MAGRSYGQFCGLARALELVGERWALLIVRDLLVGPRRFTDLRQGLPRIPSNVLSERLKQLEQAGVVRRRVLPRPAASVVYELTDYGSQLDDAVRQLGRWGAQALGQPRAGEIITTDALIMALRSTFRAEAARGLRASYELHVGDVVIHARVDGARLTVGEGSLSAADLVMDVGPGLKDLLSGELSPSQALADNSLHIVGDAQLLDRFVDVFQIPRRPACVA